MPGFSNFLINFIERLFVLSRRSEFKGDINVDDILGNGKFDLTKIGTRLESCEDLGNLNEKIFIMRKLNLKFRIQ